MRLPVGTAIEAFRSMPVWVLLVPVALMSCNTAIHSVRLFVLLRRMGTAASYLGVCAAIFRASFVGAFLPTGAGEVAKVYWMSRSVGRTAPVVLSLFVARMMEVICWGCILLLGWWSDVGLHLPILGKLSLFAGLFFVLAGSLGLLAIARGWSWMPAVSKLVGKGEGIPALVDSLDARSLLLVAVLSLPFTLTNALCVWTLLGQQGLLLEFPDVLWIFSAGDVLISLPVTISGVGVREGVFLHVLAPLGLSSEKILAVAWCRWTGELGRAMIGGMLFVLGGSTMESINQEASGD
jgi:glycosyltransferase 2 family protein